MAQVGVLEAAPLKVALREVGLGKVRVGEVHVSCETCRHFGFLKTDSDEKRVAQVATLEAQREWLGRLGPVNTQKFGFGETHVAPAAVRDFDQAQIAAFKNTFFEPALLKNTP